MLKTEKWPRDLQFLFQIDLSTIPSRLQCILGSSGLLQLFWEKILEDDIALGRVIPAENFHLLEAREEPVNDEDFEDVAEQNYEAPPENYTGEEEMESEDEENDENEGNEGNEQESNNESEDDGVESIVVDEPQENDKSETPDQEEEEDQGTNENKGSAENNASEGDATDYGQQVEEEVVISPKPGAITGWVERKDYPGFMNYGGSELCESLNLSIDKFGGYSSNTGVERELCQYCGQSHLNSKTYVAHLADECMMRMPFGDLGCGQVSYCPNSPNSKPTNGKEYIRTFVFTADA